MVPFLCPAPSAHRRVRSSLVCGAISEPPNPPRAALARAGAGCLVYQAIPKRPNPQSAACGYKPICPHRPFATLARGLLPDAGLALPSAQGVLVGPTVTTVVR